MRDFWVYILHCADGHYYVGSHRGISPETRVNEHNAGLDTKAYTYSRRPVERQIKGWSRAEKEALIDGDWQRVHTLAKNYAEYEKPRS